MIILSKSVEETEKAAENLAKRHSPPRVYCLYGELGAGKTAFARGLARGYGYGGRVNSPTFNIMQLYGENPKIHHFDLYRIKDEDELFETGFEQFLGEGVSIIEWPDKFEHLIPEGAIRVYLKYFSDSERQIEVREP